MQLTLAKMFGDNMVLQQKKPLSVWGWAVPGEVVQLGIQGQRAEAQVLEDGSWRARLLPLKASLQETLTVSCLEETLVCENVMVGEVWLAGGQSNMEFHMLFDREYEQEKGRCGNRAIRFFDYPEISYEGQDKDFDYSAMGYWRLCDEENLKYYSAPAYYFARKLQETLEVPVGIVGCNWGGSRACCWMNEEYLKKHGQIWMEEYEEGLRLLEDEEAYRESYRRDPANSRGLPFEDPLTMLMLPGISREEQLLYMKQEEEKNRDRLPQSSVIGPCHATRPCGLYEYMLRKVAPYMIKGVLWYQGESDEMHADLYEDVLSDLIDCWRALWQEELPFYLVQLPGYEIWLTCTGERFPRLREAQAAVADKKETVYLISVSDAGMRYDIHPKWKRPVGERLALAALAQEYGRPLLWQAPMVKSWQWAEERDEKVCGLLLQITFEYAGNGLYLKGEGIQALEIEKLEGGAYRKLDADSYEVSVRGACVFICLNEGTGEEAEDMWDAGNAGNAAGSYRIRFAKTPYYEVNLYNSAGIPAVPFQIVI